MTFKVKKKMCDQCLYTQNKIVSDERKESLLDGIEAKGGHFICHKASIAGEDTCCKGFYDNNDFQLKQVAQRLNVVEFVD